MRVEVSNYPAGGEYQFAGAMNPAGYGDTPRNFVQIAKRTDAPTDEFPDGEVVYEVYTGSVEDPEAQAAWLHEVVDVLNSHADELVNPPAPEEPA